MKLKNKIFLVILFALTLQIITSAGFVIFAFLSQAEDKAKEELTADWERSKLYIEKLKHYSFNQIISLSKYLKDHESEIDEENFAARSIKYFKTSDDIDFIFVLDENKRLIANYFTDKSGVYPSIGTILSQYDFNYPKNKFIYYERRDGSNYLSLVTGSKIFLKDQNYIILLIKNINNSFLNNMSQDLGFNIAFYSNQKHICASIPLFRSFNMQNKFQKIETSTGRYNIIITMLSNDLNNKIYLIVFKSTLDYNIYTSNIIKSLILAFLITLSVTAIFALSMTAFFTSPFVKLHKWINDYMKTGKLTEFKVSRKDDIGFLINSFHSLAKKIIQEEKLIKDQLKKITFLNKYNENILKNLHSGVLVLNQEYKIEYFNEYFKKLLNIKEDNMFSLTFLGLLNNYFKIPKNLKNLDSQNLKNESLIENVVYRRNNEKKIKFIVKIIPIKISEIESKTLIVFEDITQIDEFWKKMLQAEKISSIGILSTGMAHEINNPLGSILSHVQYLLEVENNDEKKESLKWIENETERIADIIQRLLDFSRSFNEKTEYSFINLTIKEVIKLLIPKIKKKKINIEEKLFDEDIRVKIDNGSLKQVLLNIIINAVQALNENGVICVEIKDLQKQVEISINDDGEGISKKDLKYIFDPFFTTKKNKGTGLGLSISYSIIKSAGGDIIVESKKHFGTKVKILLNKRI